MPLIVCVYTPRPVVKEPFRHTYFLQLDDGSWRHCLAGVYPSDAWHSSVLNRDDIPLDLEPCTEPMGELAERLNLPPELIPASDNIVRCQKCRRMLGLAVGYGPQEEPRVVVECACTGPCDPIPDAASYAVSQAEWLNTFGQHYLSGALSRAHNRAHENPPSSIRRPTAPS